MEKKKGKKFKFKLNKILRVASLPALLFLALVLLVLLTYQVIFTDKIFPRIYIGDKNVSFLNRVTAYKVIDSSFSQRMSQTLTFEYSGQKFRVDLATSSASIKKADAINQAFLIGHQGSIFAQIYDQITSLIFGYLVAPQISFSSDEQFEKINKAIYLPPKDASLIIPEGISEASSAASSSAHESEIKINEGQNGLELDREVLKILVQRFIIFGQTEKDLPIKVANPSITTSNAKRAKKIIEESFKEPVKLTFSGKNWVIDTKTLISLLDLTQSEKLLVSNEKLSEYLSAVAKELDQPVIEGQFSFSPETKRVSTFASSQEGRKLNIAKAATLINLALENKRSKEVTLPVDIVQPKIKTEQVNDLGINELLGRGISHFSGSITNRVYNISLAASRINGILVPPGEIFSFNDKVGDISAASGYKQAYVIKSGRTVLDDGGGVCQDSTTLFRAVLNTGLPVVARTAHAYRVGYYEQSFPPGLDATVFAPSVDFKFKNDTPAHILIQAYTSGNTLYVDIYGTSDGRVSTLTKPIIHSQTPPLPELRQDDPNLPKGEVKQVDWPAWGANVTFSRTVTRGTETIIQETFKSNYRPWQAIFMVGTKEG